MRHPGISSTGKLLLPGGPRQRGKGTVQRNLIKMGAPEEGPPSGAEAMEEPGHCQDLRARGGAREKKILDLLSPDDQLKARAKRV